MKYETLKKQNARLKIEVDNLKSTIKGMENTIMRLSGDLNNIESVLKSELCYECKERIIGV